MDAIVTTSKDFSSQYIVDGRTYIKEIQNPSKVLDDRLVESANRLELYFLLQSYRNVKTGVSASIDSVGLVKKVVSPPDAIPTFLDYALASYIDKQGLTGPSIHEFDSSSGFVGMFAGQKKLTKQVFSYTSSSSSLKSSVGMMLLRKPNGPVSDIGLKLGKSSLYFKSSRKTPFNWHGQYGAYHKDMILDVKPGSFIVCAPYVIPDYYDVFPNVYKLFASIAKKSHIPIYIAHSHLAFEKIDMVAFDLDMDLSYSTVATVPFSLERSNSMTPDDLPLGLLGGNYHELMVSRLV